MHTAAFHTLQAAQRRYRWSQREGIRVVLRSHLRAAWRPLWYSTPKMARAWQSLVLSALMLAGQSARHAQAQSSYPATQPQAASITAVIDNQALIVTGTSAADTIRITSEDGNVKINGADPATGPFASADIAAIRIDAGDGNDTIDVSAVTSPLFGNGPMFEILGGAGDDVVQYSVAGNGYLNGGTGHNKLQVTSDGEIVLTASTLSIKWTERATFNGFTEALLVGGPGEDWIDASTFNGPVELVGGGGNDWLIGSAYDDVFDPGTGDNTIIDHNPDDRDLVRHSADSNMFLTDQYLQTTDTLITFNGFVEQALLIGGPSANVIHATRFNGPVELLGGAGDDQLYGTAYDDIFDPGVGNDRITDWTSSDRDTLRYTNNSDMTLENNRLSAFGNTITFNGFVEAALLTGGPGANRIDAGGFTGGVTLAGGDGADTLIGGAGDDLIDGGAGDDRIEAGPGDDEINGGSGTDTYVQTVDADQSLTDSLATGQGNDSFQRIELAIMTGGTGNNTIDASGFGGSVVINGVGGNDTLMGGAGADTIDGGTGDDRISGNAGDDQLSGGTGSDTVIQTVDADQSIMDTRVTGQGTDTISGFEQAELTGGAGNNVIEATGFSGSVQLRGLNGNDSLTGGAGDDLLEGGPGNDTLRGGPGNDTLRGGEGDDTLFWSFGDDLLDGGSGSNTIIKFTSYIPMIGLTDEPE